MSTKAEKERQKQIQDKCQTLLTQMLRDEDNKYCVDCDAKGPRWASWNLGIFLCIRCAGIHRNLGVHISKVKSVNLDSWTPEQVVSLQQMGNSRARAIYEANLPDNFRRPQTDSALEAFVRAKYEAKKYIAREWVPLPVPKVNWDKELDEEAERAKKKKRESKLPAAPISNSVRKLESVIPQPLPKPSTSPKPQRTTQLSAPTVSTSSSQPSADLLGLDTPIQENRQTQSTDNGFTSFLSAPTTAQPPTQSNQRSAEEESFFNQPQNSPAPATPGKLTTDSILALYGKTQGPTQGPLQTFPIQGGYMQMGSTNSQVSAFQSSPFAAPNGIIPPTQIPVQRTMFPSMSGVQPTAINPTSNPFYNMTGSSAVNPPQLVPVPFPQGNMIAQQMTGLSLGAPVVGTVPSNPYQPSMPPPLWQ